MARHARLSLPGLPHLVRQTSVHGQPLAADDADRQAMLDALQHAAQANQLGLWGYALLPQALWLLACPAEPAGPDALGRAMQALGRRYVAAFNRRHGRRGALWGGRFQAALVEPGEWVLTALAFVECQALAHDAEGVWSSAPHHLGLRRDPLLAEAPALWPLGNTPFERETAWRARLQAPADAAADARLARAVHGGWAIGSAAFVGRVGTETGRPASPRRPGRPRRARPAGADA